MRFAFVILIVAGAGACTPAPGFSPADAPAGARLVLAADVADDGTSADVRVEAHDLPPLFGLSYHLVADGPVTLAHAGSRKVFGSDDEAVQVQAVDGNDVALGGTRRSPERGEVTIADGTIGDVVATARAAGVTRLTIEDAALVHDDGSIETLDVAGGTLTLEAP